MRSIEPNAFEDFVRVKQLDISHNELTSLRDNQFTYLESIECLNLSHNSIDTILPFTFTDLRTLRSIDLAHNRLTSDEFIRKIAELQSLNLSSNRYSSINLTAIVNINKVELIGNLWSCAWLVIELVNATLKIGDDVQFGTKLAGFDFNAIGIRQPEEVICYDGGNAEPETIQLIPRHVVVVYPKNQCSETEVNV